MFKRKGPRGRSDRSLSAPEDQFKSARLQLLDKIEVGDPKLRSRLFSLMRAAQRADGPILEVLRQARTYNQGKVEIERRTDDLRRAVETVKEVLAVPPYSTAERSRRLRVLEDIEIEFAAAVSLELATQEILEEYRRSLLAGLNKQTQWGPGMLQAAEKAVEIAGNELKKQWQSSRQGYVALLCFELGWFPGDEEPDLGRLGKRLNGRFLRAPKRSPEEIEQFQESAARLVVREPDSAGFKPEDDRTLWRSQVKKRRADGRV